MEAIPKSATVEYTVSFPLASLLLPLLIVGLLVAFLPPMQNGQRGLTARELVSLVATVLLARLAAAYLATFTIVNVTTEAEVFSVPVDVFLPLALALFYGLLLPVFAAALAGRRPFVSGIVANLVFWRWAAAPSHLGAMSYDSNYLDTLITQGMLWQILLGIGILLAEAVGMAMLVAKLWKRRENERV